MRVVSSCLRAVRYNKFLCFRCPPLFTHTPLFCLPQALLDYVQEVDGVMLTQANAIAAELCTTIQFASHILIGAEGFNNASITIDELLDANENVRIKVPSYWLFTVGSTCD